MKSFLNALLLMKTSRKDTGLMAAAIALNGGFSAALKAVIWVFVLRLLKVALPLVLIALFTFFKSF